MKSGVKRTVLTAKATVIEAPEAVSSEICQSLAKAAGKDAVDQEDLLHVRSVLVTTGANENHDVFTRDELWAARFSPIHKPSDWDHNRLKIVGHIYNVEARTLDGESLDLNAAEPTTMGGEPHFGDFELIVDEVVYAYLLPEYAEAIKERSRAGKLFVSMEVWFKDYDYAVWDAPVTAAESTKPSSVSLLEGISIVPRDENVHMEPNLRTAGGTGQTEDGKLLGRALKNMIFGGKGYVGVPANPRSSIEAVGNEVEEITPASLRDVANQQTFRNVDESGDGWTHAYEVRLTDYDSEYPYFSVYGEFTGDTMQDAINAFERFEVVAYRYVEEALKAVGTSREIKEAPCYKSVEFLGNENKVQYTMDFQITEQEQGRVSYKQLLEEIGLVSQSVTASVDQEVQDLEVESMNADMKRLETQVEELKTQIAALQEENASLKTAAQNEEHARTEAARLEKLDDLVRAVAAPDITKELFARMDEVLKSNMTGEEQANALWEMRIDFIRQTASTYQENAQAAEAKLNEYRTTERYEQVVALDLYNEDRLEKVKEQIAGMTDEEFSEWFEEKKEFAGMIAEKAAKAAEETDETPEETEEKAEAEAETEETKSEDEEIKEKAEAKAETEETDEVTEEDVAEAAMEALATASGEETPKFEETEKGESEEDPKEDSGVSDLVNLTTTNTSERLERLKKTRKNFGR